MNLAPISSVSAKFTNKLKVQRYPRHTRACIYPSMMRFEIDIACIYGNLEPCTAVVKISPFLV